MLRRPNRMVRLPTFRTGALEVTHHMSNDGDAVIMIEEKHIPVHSSEQIERRREQSARRSREYRARQKVSHAASKPAKRRELQPGERIVRFNAICGQRPEISSNDEGCSAVEIRHIDNYENEPSQTIVCSPLLNQYHYAQSNRSGHLSRRGKRFLTQEEGCKGTHSVEQFDLPPHQAIVPFSTVLLQPAASSSLQTYSNFVFGLCSDSQAMKREDDPLPGVHIELCRNSARLFPCVPKCFDYKIARQINKKLGPFFSSVGPHYVVLHQAVVTMCITCDIAGSKASFWELSDLSISRLADNVVSDTVIILYWPEDPSVEESTRAFDNVEKLRRKLAPEVRVRSYPSRSEYDSMAGKIDDINVLNDIANLPETLERWRPQTCHSLPCKLNPPFVLKRTHSSCSEHVDLAPRKKSLANLPCRGSSPSVVFWFHQQYVESFQESGEFRVFVATRRDKNGIRGRRTYVVEIIHTYWGPNDTIVTTTLGQQSDSELLQYSGVGVRKLGDLRTNVLSITDKVRERPDWKEKFESMEIGGRIDISISPASYGHQFFVNEITREWYGDYFSSFLENPHTRICQSLAQARAEYFHDTMT